MGMSRQLFSPMEIDALGEMINISLGSSATAVSNLLDHRVDITTPKVSVETVKDFALGELEPAMGVEIKYVEGLEGSNIMLLRRCDVKVIVDILMGMETPDEEFELNELTISAVCEVMNQMMGAASTAMSDFLGYPVNISTPIPFELDDLDQFKQEHFPQGADTVVVIRFAFKIEGALESEFMNVMSVELAKELLRGLGLEMPEDVEESPAPAPAPAEASGSSKQLSQAEIEAMMGGMGAGTSAPTPAPAETPGASKQLSQAEIEAMMGGMGAGVSAPATTEAAGSSKQLSQGEIEAMMNGMGGGSAAASDTAAQQTPQMPMNPAMMGQPGMGMPMPMQGMPGMSMPGGPGGQGWYMPMYMPYPPTDQAAVRTGMEPKVISTKPVSLKELDGVEPLPKEQAENLDLIMEVPLQVTVEIGRTRRKVQDILEFSKGSLDVLDKLAGDQVDLFVNGKCIAKGDVVVVDDNFGVRITEIVKSPLTELQSSEG